MEVLSTRSFFLTLGVVMVLAMPAQGAPSLVLCDELLQDKAVAVANLLGHFPDLDVRVERTGRVSPGEIAEAESLFFLARIDSPPPSMEQQTALLSRDSPTCYVGDHAWLGALPGRKQGLRFTYRDRSYPMDSYSHCPYQKLWGTPVAWFGEAGDGAPFVEFRGRQWLVHGIPVFGREGFAFADVLHDILGREHTPLRRAMIRLEDINPSYEGERLKMLKSAIAYLVEEGIPFSMAVYPAFINPGGEKRARVLADNPELSSLLRRAERQGGTVIMHGTSHQYHQVSGEGSEFWDIEADAPIPDELAYFHRRMRYGLWLFREAGLHPLLFEAPHYNMPLSLQKELPLYFGTLAGELMLNDESYRLTQSLPYLIESSYAGLRVLPEQLGYISYEAREISVNAILENLDDLTSLVRDPFACFFYHPYVAGDEYLKVLVPELRRRGFSFYDAAEGGESPRVEVVPVEPIWPKIRPVGRRIGRIALFMAVPVALLFLAIYLWFHRRRKKDLFR